MSPKHIFFPYPVFWLLLVTRPWELGVRSSRKQGTPFFFLNQLINMCLCISAIFSTSYTLTMLLVKPLLPDSFPWLFLWAKSPVKMCQQLASWESAGQQKAKRNKRLMLDSQDANRKRGRLMGQQSASVSGMYTPVLGGEEFFPTLMLRWKEDDRIGKHFKGWESTYFPLPTLVVEQFWKSRKHYVVFMAF